MFGKFILLILFTLTALFSTDVPSEQEAIFEQEDTYDVSGEISNLFALWAGDIEGDRVPITMRRYRTRGTPEIANIDKNVNIRFQQFGYFETQTGKQLIRKLVEETMQGNNKTAG